MSNEPNEQYTTIAQAEIETPVIRRKIGKTTYIVKLHFSETETDTLKDKINRLLRSEVEDM